MNNNFIILRIVISNEILERYLKCQELFDQLSLKIYRKLKKLLNSKVLMKRNLKYKLDGLINSYLLHSLVHNIPLKEVWFHADVNIKTQTVIFWKVGLTYSVIHKELKKKAILIPPSTIKRLVVHL